MTSKGRAIMDRGKELISSVVPTRFFLGKPEIGEELAISIEQGKTLTIKMLAVGPLNTEKGTREVFFELNGEVSYTFRPDLKSRSKAERHIKRGLALMYRLAQSLSKTPPLPLSTSRAKRPRVTPDRSVRPCRVSWSMCGSRKGRRSRLVTRSVSCPP